MEAIAEASGFGTASALRHHFRARFGTSPAAYRRTFGGGTDGATPARQRPTGIAPVGSL